MFGLAYWGYHTGRSPTTALLLAVGAPALGFGFWALVDFRAIGRGAEAARLFQELAITGAVAVALVSIGAHLLGWTMIGVSLAHHVLVYVTGHRLLERGS